MVFQLICGWFSSRNLEFFVVQSYMIGLKTFTNAQVYITFGTPGLNLFILLFLASRRLFLVRTDHAAFSDSTSVDKVLSTKSGKYCGMRASRMPSYFECS